MSRSIDLESLKRKLYLSYHGDGILDLVIGLTILGFGISMKMDSSASIILSWLGIILYAPLKNIITVPRMGYVQFDDKRTRKTRLMILLGIGAATFLLFLALFMFARSDAFSVEFEAWFEQYYLLVLSVFPALILAGAALLLGVHRWLIHAFLIVAIIFVGIQLDVPEPTSVMVLGGTVLLIGLGLLGRFLRKYPNADTGDEDGLV